MAPPIGVVLASPPHRDSPGQTHFREDGSDNGVAPKSPDQNGVKIPTQHPHRLRSRGISSLHPSNSQQQSQQLLRLPRTGSDRRQHAGNNNNRADVNANRRKIRRQGSLKTIQEENMPIPPYSSVIEDMPHQHLQQPTTRQTLKGATKGLHVRRSTTQQQQQPPQKLTQQCTPEIETNGVGIPPSAPAMAPLSIDPAHHTISAFIPDDDIPLLLPDGSGNDDHQSDSFLSQPRGPSSSSLYNDSSLLGYDNLARVLNFHPKYLEIFLQCHLHLLTGDGPLPFTHRAYIGIMAVSRVRCSPLAQTLSRDFLNLGGDPAWLEGIYQAPKKIRNLSVINKVLAHRPWLVRKSHVAELMKNIEQEQWSASELVHALTLLTHFHALATFVCASGLQRDDEAAAAAAVGSGNSTPPSSPGSGLNNGGGNSPTESSWLMDSVVERMQRRFNNRSREELTQEECVKRFFTVGSQTAELPGFRSMTAQHHPRPTKNGVAFPSARGVSSPSEDSLMASTMETMTVSTSPVDDLLLQRFVEDPHYGYDSTLFDGKNTTSSIATDGLPRLLRDEENEHLLCVQDYSWQEHGFSVLNRFYDAEGSNLLDDKLSVAENLTYRTMATHSGVDTYVFRRAIWNYIDVLFGIRHDDYDYKDIDELLPTTMKKFIKAAVCFPDKLGKKDYRNSMRELKHSEKIHINVLMMEARFQGEMLYALRAVTQHLV